jgi:superkiller protein 3
MSGRLGLADSHLALGEYAAAAAEYDRALALDPSNGFAHRAAGIARINLDRYGDALVSLRRAAELLPDDAYTQDLIANVQNELGHPEAAVAASLRAISLHPNDATAVNSYVGLSWYYSFSGRHQASLDAARRAAALNPQEQMAFTNMCRALNDLGQHTEALSACRRALGLKPGDGETLYYQGVAFDKLGQKQRALDSFREAASAFESAPATQTDFYYLRGNVYQQLGRNAGAVESYRAALARRPNFAQALLNLGAVYAASGNVREATEQYNRLLRIDPARAEKLLGVIRRR